MDVVSSARMEQHKRRRPHHISGSLNGRFTSSLEKRRNELLSRPPYASEPPGGSERVVECRVTSQIAGREPSQMVRTRPLAHGAPHPTPLFETDDLAEVGRNAAAENGAPRRVPDFGMLALLLKPDPSFLSYACSELVVGFCCARITDLRDMNTFLGQKRLGRSRS